MRWEKELFKAGSSLVLLGMAVCVGMYAAHHFLRVVERREKVSAPVVENVSMAKRTVAAPERRIAVLFQQDGHEAFIVIQEFLWGVAPAIALFICVYFVITRLVIRLLTAAGS